WDVAGGDHHAPVADASAHDGAAEAPLPAFGVVADSPGGHEAALAPATDGHAIAVRPTILDDQVDPGQNVGPVFLADRVQYRRGELLAMPGAAARVRQEHQETL